MILLMFVSSVYYCLSTVHFSFITISYDNHGFTTFTFHCHVVVFTVHFFTSLGLRFPLPFVYILVIISLVSVTGKESTYLLYLWVSMMRICHEEGLVCKSHHLSCLFHSIIVFCHHKQHSCLSWAHPEKFLTICPVFS